MIDEWGIVVLFALAAGFLQGWIAQFTHDSGLFLGVTFLILAVYLERKRKKIPGGG